MGAWLITGANRGIGLELTRQAAAAGHRVFAAAREPAKATDLKSLAKQADVRTVSLDVANPESFVALQRDLARESIDVLVNNAGVIGPARQSALDMDYEGFAQTLAVNVFGPLRGIQIFLPNLERAGGKAATISSLMGSAAQGGSYQLAYSASKAALNRLLRGVAAELKPKGIAIGIYSPGWVRTDMGGAGAPLTVQQSAAGLRQRIAELDMRRSGEFINWDGKILPW